MYPSSTSAPLFTYHAHHSKTALPPKQNLHPQHLGHKCEMFLRLLNNANIKLANHSSSELHQHEHGEMSPNAHPAASAKAEPTGLDVVLHTTLFTIEHLGRMVFQPALWAELRHVRAEVALVVVDLISGHGDGVAWRDVVLVELATGRGNLAGQGEGDGGLETECFAYSGFEDWVLVLAVVVAEEVFDVKSVVCCRKLLNNFLQDVRVTGEFLD